MAILGLFRPEITDYNQIIQIFTKNYIFIIFLFLSHGVSYFTNFLGNKEYEHTTISEQREKSFKRVLVMHLAIISGGFLLAIFQDQSMALLVALIILKIGFDLHAHLKEHGYLNYKKADN